MKFRLIVKCGVRREIADGGHDGGSTATKGFGLL